MRLTAENGPFQVIAVYLTSRGTLNLGLAVDNAWQVMEQAPQEIAATNSSFDPTRSMHLKLRFEDLDKRLTSETERTSSAPSDERDPLSTKTQELFGEAYRTRLELMRSQLSDQGIALQLEGIRLSIDRAREISRLGFAMIYGGLILFALGILLWYFRWQVHQDQLLREKLRCEILQSKSQQAPIESAS
jgi:hypothetical protein